MPTLTIVIGANGAGKSTWRRHHRDRLPAAFYDADSIAEGLGSFDDPAHQRGARDLVDRRIEEHLDRGESFGFESTYSGASRPAIVRRARALGYDVNAVFIGTHSPDINIRRIADRVEQRTGHDVPQAETIRRWTASQENLVNTAPEFSSIRLVDNSGTAAVNVAEIASRDRPAPATAPQLPRWARDLSTSIMQSREQAGQNAEQAEHPSAALDDRALRRSWREHGRVMRQAGRDLTELAADAPRRPTVAKRLEAARGQRADIEVEARRRGLELAPQRAAGKDRGAGHGG